MNKRRFFTVFLAFILIFSISAINAVDSNSTAIAIDDGGIVLEDSNQFDECGDEDILSDDLNDFPMVEDVKNQTVMSPQSGSIYYQGTYNVVLRDSNSSTPLSDKEINFIINDVNYTSWTDSEGIAGVNLKLNPGRYDIFAYFEGDDIFGYSNLTSSFSVLPTIKAADVSKYYKGNAPYVATFLDSQGNPLANSQVSISVNGKSYSKKTNSKGVVSLQINLKPGSYKITSTDPITGYNLTSNLKVLPTVSSKNLKILVKDKKKFTAKFLKGDGKVLSKKVVKFKLKGKIYKVKTNSKGVAGISLKNLKKGTYRIVCYNRDGFSKSYEIKVYTSRASTRLTTHFYTYYLNESKTVKVKLSTGWGDDTPAGKVIKIKINGKTYSKKTDGKGIVYLKLPSLKKGLYSVEYSYKGNKYFKSSKAVNLLTVIDSSATSLKVKGTTRFGYGAGTQMKVAYSSGGVPLAKRSVTFTIDGRTYSKSTDNKGIAYLPINLKIGKHAVNYTSGNESRINGTSGSCEIEVFKRANSKILWKCGSSFKDSSQTFKILLTDAKGKPVSGQKVELTIDGETYVSTTSSKGYATFKTSVAIGKYKISFKFPGSNDYLSSHNSKSVNVKLSMFKNGINQKNAASYLKAFLKSSSHCQVGNAKIKKLVKSLTRGLTDEVDKAKAIFNYVRDTLEYSYYYDSRYGAVGTLNHKKGNCVDHSHLLVAMFRTAGFKAKYVHGTCRFSDGDVTGHVWTQVLIGKNWVCADATSYRNSLGKVANWNTKSFKVHGKYSSLPF